MPFKGLVLSPKSLSGYFSRRQQAPIILALPVTGAFTTLTQPHGINGVVLYPQYRRNHAPLLAIQEHGYAVQVLVSFLETQYTRSGREAHLQDMQGRYLSAKPCLKEWRQSDFESNNVEFSRSKAGEWERFYLNPINRRWISKSLRQLISNRLMSYCSTPSSFPNVYLVHVTKKLFFLRQLKMTSLGKMLPQYANVEAARVNRKRMGSSLKTIATSYEIGSDYDYLGKGSQIFKGDAFSPPAFGNYLARSSNTPVLGPCIVATARNEGVYLPDWCAYHFALGFEHIYLYTNDNDDLTIEIATRVAALTGRLTLIHNVIKDSDVRPQLKAYRHAFSISREVLSHDWCAVIDIDEYITVKPSKANYSRIGSLINKLETKSLFPPDVIALNWVYAGLDRNLDFNRAPAPLPERVGMAISKNNHIKSIFRPQHFLASHCHYPIENPAHIATVVDSCGDLYTPYYTSKEPGISPEARVGNAAVIHFWHKSLPEFLWKNMRNAGDEFIQSKNDVDIPRLEKYSSLFAVNNECEHRAIRWIKSDRQEMTKHELSQIILADKVLLDLVAESWLHVHREARKVAANILESCSCSKSLTAVLQSFTECDGFCPD